MPLSHIEHVLVQTDDIERTCEWYERVLGMRRGPHPDFRFPVASLYLGECDVVHVTQGGGAVSENRRRYVGQQSGDTRGSGAIDHIAFRCSGLRGTLAHLRALEVPFRERQVDDQGLYQLFLMDPNDIKIELNFPAAEAAGLTPELRASDL
jgi:catechol 2,3-dioxygenase-like lactoylglutathione lyase family enzyme